MTKKLHLQTPVCLISSANRHENEKGNQPVLKTTNITRCRKVIFKIWFQNQVKSQQINEKRIRKKQKLEIYEYKN